MSEDKDKVEPFIQISTKSLIRAGNAIEITNKLIKPDLENEIEKTINQSTEEEINKKQVISEGSGKQKMSKETKAKIMLALQALEQKGIIKPEMSNETKLKILIQIEIAKKGI